MSSNQLQLTVAIGEEGIVMPLLSPVRVGTTNVPAPKLVELGSAV